MAASAQQAVEYRDIFSRAGTPLRAGRSDVAGRAIGHARSADEPIVAGPIRRPRVREERVRRARLRRQGPGADVDAAQSVSMERDRPRWHRAHRLQGVRQSRRRHVSRGRRLARAHEHAGDVDVGARASTCARCASRFCRRPNSTWKAATQLFPTSDPWTFTAPNLQYLMDSPTELSDYTLRSFTVQQSRRQGIHDSHGRAPRRRSRRRSTSTPPAPKRS